MPDQQTATATVLFRRIAEGDEAAFEALFHQYMPQIIPVIRKVIREEGPEMDIVQEVFLGLWLGRDKLSTIDTPHNWIFRMVYHRCYSWLQKQEVRRRASQQLGVLETSSSVQTQEDLDFAETTRLLQQAVSLLPPQAQRIYLLSRETDMKIADIASQLSISTQTVKNSIVRSLRFIREYLSTHGIVLPMAILAVLFSLR
ncbi:sigma-70 family RNA polymerase sigma factor [Chitinophaga sp. CB10]|uniref:sigma-70 family RNA polymerase sigma factor n=1 Tax=Chitinophaga sp. CB10 TaxID=1891659 RepID=UPI0025C35249|nr:sigma-70 family RNA polymerase sigma factor [Chitinophaga sp. CB10]